MNIQRHRNRFHVNSFPRNVNNFEEDHRIGHDLEGGYVCSPTPRTWRSISNKSAAYMAADDQQLSIMIEQILIAGSQDKRQTGLRFDPRV